MSEHAATKSAWASYGGNVVGNLIFGYCVLMLPVWFPQYLTAGYAAVSWVLLGSAVVQIVGNLMLLIYAADWFRYLLEIIMQLASLAAGATLLVLLPFNFDLLAGGHIWRLALIICTAIGLVVAVVTVATRFFQLAALALRQL